MSPSLPSSHCSHRGGPLPSGPHTADSLHTHTRTHTGKGSRQLAPSPKLFLQMLISPKHLKLLPLSTCIIGKGFSGSLKGEPSLRRVGRFTSGVTTTVCLLIYLFLNLFLYVCLFIHPFVSCMCVYLFDDFPSTNSFYLCYFHLSFMFSIYGH